MSNLSASNQIPSDKSRMRPATYGVWITQLRSLQVNKYPQSPTRVGAEEGLVRMDLKDKDPERKRIMSQDYGIHVECVIESSRMRKELKCIKE